MSTSELENKQTKVDIEERIFVATQWQLMWWKFRKHKPAMIGGYYHHPLLYCRDFL